MRSLGLIFVLLAGCSSSSFDISSATDSDAGRDTFTEADATPNVDTGTATEDADADVGPCTDPPLSPPPCIAAEGTYASQFDYASGATTSPVRLDATREHRFSFGMGVDGRIEKVVLRIKAPSAVSGESISVELIASVCSVETVLAEAKQAVTSSGDYAFRFDNTTKLPLIVRAGTRLQVRFRTDSFTGYDVYVVKEPLPNPDELTYSYRALPDGAAFTPIGDVVPAVAVWTRGCGI